LTFIIDVLFADLHVACEGDAIVEAVRLGLGVVGEEDQRRRARRSDLDRYQLKQQQRGKNGMKPRGRHTSFQSDGPMASLVAPGALRGRAA